MPPITTKGSKALGEAIKARRVALGLSAEEAARRAGVGTKTWFRYEAAGSIRNDKIKGVCKALSWVKLPQNNENNPDTDGIKAEKSWLESVGESDAGWSNFLASNFGRKAAVSFAVGIEILEDYLTADLEELSQMPKGSHIGELQFSWLKDSLPGQFLMMYDYDFLYQFRSSLIAYRQRAHFGREVHAHTVVEELLTRLIRECAFDEIDEWIPEFLANENDSLTLFQETEGWKEWPENLCGDDDLSLYLNDGSWVEAGHDYHFDNWFKKQFYLDRE